MALLAVGVQIRTHPFLERDTYVISTHLHADGYYKDLLYCGSGVSKGFADKLAITMAGNEVFKVAVTKLGQAVDETLAANGLDRGALDWLVPHQANIRIIQATARKLDLPMERVIVTVQEHGNTSAASVPLALDVAVRDGRIKRGDLLLLEAFGGGFTWGSAFVRYRSVSQERIPLLRDSKEGLPGRACRSSYSLTSVLILICASDAAV